MCQTWVRMRIGIILIPIRIWIGINMEIRMLFSSMAKCFHRTGRKVLLRVGNTDRWCRAVVSTSCPTSRG